jgi:hypothetical protein
VLRDEEPELAVELERIGWQLDAENFSTSIREHTTGDNLLSAEDIGKECRQIVGMWEKLVDRVRQLLNFRCFLKPIPFCQLHQACTAGHVIIINSSIYGVNTLIFGDTGPIEHVPLPDVDLGTLTKSSANVVLKQPASASAAQQRTYTTNILKPALWMVWNKIMIHIFDKIGIPLEDCTVPPLH